MANEVIISEFGIQEYKTEGEIQPIYGEPTTSQVLDIATASAALGGRTAMVRLQSMGVGFWYNTGATAALAACTANTDGNHWLPGQHIHRLTGRRLCPCCRRSACGGVPRVRRNAEGSCGAGHSRTQPDTGLRVGAD